MRTSAIGLIVSMGLIAGAVSAGELRSYAGGSFALGVDGQSVALKSVEGGGIKANVATVGSAMTVQKAVTTFAYEDLTLELGLDGPADVYDWLDSAISKSYIRKNIVLTECTLDMKAVAERSASQAVVTEIGFPGFGGQANGPGYLKLKLAPEIVQAHATSGDCKVTTTTTRQRGWIPSNFKLELDGIDTSGVTAVQPFSIKIRAAPVTLGETRENAGTRPDKLELPDLVLSVNRAKAADFEAWVSDFVIAGHSENEKEKAGALVMLDATRKSEVARVTLSHVGISGLTLDPANPALLTVTLYVEGMRLSVGGAAPKALKSVPAGKTASARIAPASAPAKVSPGKVAPTKVAPAKAVKGK